MAKSRRWCCLSLAVLALASACQSAVEPHTVVPVDFTFGVHRLQTEPPFMVDTRDAAVVVRGYLVTPCQPYDASATATVDGATLVLRVIGRATRECPQDIVTSVGYQAVLRTPPAPHARLRVVHEWRDVNWPAAVMLEVPLPE